MGCYKYEKTGLFGYVYDFSVEYNAISVDDIRNIHKYLMVKNNIVQNVTIIILCIKIFWFKCIDKMGRFIKSKMVRSKIIEMNKNYYPFKIFVNKCLGSCNTINNPFAKTCIAKTVKNLNVRIINLLTRINETKFIEWHDDCMFKYKNGPEKCNDKQIFIYVVVNAKKVLLME